MKKLVRNRLAMSGLLAGMAMVVLVAYVTVFAAPPPATIQACYNDTNGNLRLVSSPSDCRNHESPISWNVAGAPGPQGPQGDPGPQGPPGPAGGSNITTFRHTKIAANTCGPFGNFTVVDNPAINGNPDAKIFVTAIVGIQADRSNTNGNSNWYLTYTGASAFDTCAAGRWLIGGGDVTGAAPEFNVMIVGP
jgi:hypothetical protein